MREAGVESSASERVGPGARVWVFEPCGVPSRPGASPPSAPPACVRFVTGTRRSLRALDAGNTLFIGVRLSPLLRSDNAVKDGRSPRHLTIQRGYVAPACAYASRYFNFASC